jgi:type VI secretion system secreted protein VgrG
VGLLSIVKGAAGGIAKAAAGLLKTVQQALGDLGKTFSKNKPVCSATEPCPLAPVPETYGKAIKIEGDEAFRKKTIQALDDIKKTENGAALLDSIEKNGKNGKSVTIKDAHPVIPLTVEELLLDHWVPGMDFKRGNWCSYLDSAKKQADGKAGAGSDSTINFNPDNYTIGTEKWETRPPFIGLMHELIHADQAAKGVISNTLVPNDKRPDPSDPKKTAMAFQHEVEAVGLAPYDKGSFTENKIRSECKPKQAVRKWY